MMDDQDQSEPQSDEIELDIDVITKKTEKKIKLDSDALEIAANISKKMVKNVELNHQIDPDNSANRTPPIFKIQNVKNFKHFMNKGRYIDDRKQIFDVLRSLYKSSTGHELEARIKDKILERQTMVVRFISKEDMSTMKMEDQSGNEKIQIKNSIVWVGMLCIIDAVWEDGMYKLEKIHEIPHSIDASKLKINVLPNPTVANRILLIKGALWPNTSKDNIGLKVLVDQLQQLKNEQLIIDCLVIMGPFISTQNQLVEKGQLQNTYQVQFDELIQTIDQKVRKIFKYIQIVIIPSSEDAINMYPIPHPPLFSTIHHQNLHYLSNPGSIEMKVHNRTTKINLINYDILRYIDDNKAGKPLGDLMKANLDSYFKQPFLIANTLQESFDEVNLSGVYNKGEFGDIVVTSSQYSPPWAKSIGGRTFVNIGSLGIDFHLSQKHYLTLLSIYEGDGAASTRVKVQSYSCDKCI